MSILRAINKFLDIKDDVVLNLQNALIIAIDGNTSGRDISEIRAEIADKTDRFMKLVQSTAKAGIALDSNDAQFKELNDEIRALHAEEQANLTAQANKAKNNAQIKELMDLLQNETFELAEYDETITRKLINEVKVLNGTTIQVDFKTGYRVIESL